MRERRCDAQACSAPSDAIMRQPRPPWSPQAARRSCGVGLLSGLPGRTGQAGGQRAWGHWRCLANYSGEKPE